MFSPLINRLFPMYNILYNQFKKTFSCKGGEFRVDYRGRGEISGVIKDNGF